MKKEARIAFICALDHTYMQHYPQKIIVYSQKSYDMNAFQPSDFDNLIHRMERNITLATRYAQ